MKILVTLSILLCSTRAISQADSILKLAFSDTSNFHSVFEWEFKKPTKHFLLSTSEKWGRLRFKLDEDLRSDSVLKKIKKDEHHPYYHSYVFRDSMMDHLFSDQEKEFLYEEAIKAPTSAVPQFPKLYTLIKSHKEIKRVFFFINLPDIFFR